MKKYKNDRKNIETEIPDIPMKKKEITELEKHAYCCLAEEAFERIRQSFEEADEEKVLQKYVEVLLELAGKERETSLALITALAHDHATYELSVVIRDLAGKNPQLTEIFVDYFTAIGITYLCMDDLLEDDSADDMPQRCRFCDMQEECDVYE
ncbi:Uncharacterised protein [uncultured Eubacterium sp.]|uniref:hypothetical protein n=1 Tax=Brotomerdimonas butyrica TaxID=2981721 RepID=UPI0008206F43|nr:hypothetical protein [Brotomerdimonas butyrica]MCU6755998.1 hypothetical protein [Brotomerdimonas butyrica]SCH60324.1 Uncharacterised protein [uncultured Eubacterium sp.]